MAAQSAARSPSDRYQLMDSEMLGTIFISNLDQYGVPKEGEHLKYRSTLDFGEHYCATHATMFIECCPTLDISGITVASHVILYP